MFDAANYFKRNAAIWGDNVTLSHMGILYDDTEQDAIALLGASSAKSHNEVIKDAISDRGYQRDKELGVKLFYIKLAGLVLDYELAAFLLEKKAKLSLLEMERDFAREQMAHIKTVLIPFQIAMNTLELEKEQGRKVISDIEVEAINRQVQYQATKVKVMEAYFEGKVSDMSGYFNEKTGRMADYFKGKIEDMAGCLLDKTSDFKAFLDEKQRDMEAYYEERPEAFIGFYADQLEAFKALLNKKRSMYKDFYDEKVDDYGEFTKDQFTDHQDFYAERGLDIQQFYEDLTARMLGIMDTERLALSSQIQRSYADIRQIVASSSDKLVKLIKSSASANVRVLLSNNQKLGAEYSSLRNKLSNYYIDVARVAEAKDVKVLEATRQIADMKVRQAQDEATQSSKTDIYLERIQLGG